MTTSQPHRQSRWPIGGRRRPWAVMPLLGTALTAQAGDVCPAPSRICANSHPPTRWADFGSANSFAELAGAPLPANKVIDGVSFAPQLRGQKGKPRETIFTQYRDQWFVRDQRRKLYNDGRLVDTSDYPFKETELAADAEPELRRKFQKIADDLGVDKVIKAHPEWLE